MAMGAVSAPMGAHAAAVVFVEDVPMAVESFGTFILA
jgi:hypothetical protein